ncbi:MAG: SapC family protein [Gammaproteobacteria bacterium]|nr:SapC family protein [Gammaproteobacteria bacterium]
MTTAAPAIAQLNAKQHASTKIKSDYNFSHLKDQQILPVIVHEFAQASSEMPIIFIKHENGEFQPVALLGLKPSENLFYTDKKWLSDYLPAIATHYPFMMAPAEDESTKLQVYIREIDGLVNEKDGDALFDKEGKETEYMTKRKETLGRYFESSQITHAFTKHLVEKELLSEQPLNIDINGDKVTLNGLYLVDEKKLNELGDEDFLELRKRGYLAPIYCHMSSLRSVSKLVKIKAG